MSPSRLFCRRYHYTSSYMLCTAGMLVWAGEKWDSLWVLADVDATGLCRKGLLCIGVASMGLKGS